MCKQYKGSIFVLNISIGMPELLPKITIVTPSYNQGAFIEQTILSVIYQGYDNIEYFILDGGSSDNTVEVIKKYETHIDYWHSKKDNGQSAAINEGFAKATGDILYWLNSDDILMPGTLLRIGNLFKDINAPTVIFGNCLHFHQTNFKKVRGSDVVDSKNKYKLSLHNYMIQPSAFWNRAAWVKAGVLNEELCYTMDWEWFIRAEKSGVAFIPINDYLSLFRLHEVHKTSVKGQNNVRDVELAKIYEMYNGETIKRAFIKLKRITNKSKFMHNVIYAANHFHLRFISRLLHMVLVPSISYDEYNSISRM